jgi:hypothetical protein
MENADIRVGGGNNPDEVPVTVRPLGRDRDTVFGRLRVRVGRRRGRRGAVRPELASGLPVNH